MTNAIAFRGSIRHAVIAFAVASALSSCAGDLMRYTSSVRNLMPEEAVIMPPPGGPSMISVLETRYSNATDQRILLTTNARTSGQNYIDALFFGTRNYSPLNGNSISYKAVNNLNIDVEMREELTGVAMIQSPYYVQNNYGPFGYAFGYGRGNDLCLYGWQQIRSNRDGLAAFGQAGTIQIRVRFCESGATEEDLLGIMYGYTINAAVESYGWNPYGEQASPPHLLGKTGAPTYPRKAYDNRKEKVGNTSSVLKSTPATTSSARLPRSAATRVTAPVINKDEISVEVMRVQPGVAASGAVVSLPSSIAPRLNSAPSTIPTPARQAVSNAKTTASATTASKPSRSMPTPPCRLLPGSTTVKCE